MPSITLLGPQRLRPTLARVLESLRIDGPLATVTAGWEERETEDAELRDHVGGNAVNLRLWERCEKIFERDPDLLDGFRWRKDRQRRLRDLYRRQLHHAMTAVTELLDQQADADLIEPERDAAFDRVREIDKHLVDRMRECEAQFAERWRPDSHDVVGRAKDEITRRLADCGALLIAGGNTAVLLNRLKLFAVLEAAALTPIVAWSAGAMVLCGEVVLFHDSPPQGQGFAELLGPGLDICHDVIPMPHARRRLRLEDPLRVTLLARRFAPRLCVPMDEGDRLDWTGSEWHMASGTRVLTERGGVAVRHPAGRKKRRG